MGYLYIFGTIVFTVYGQLIIKSRMSYFGSLPTFFADKLAFLLKALFDPWIISGFISAFAASLFWMAAMTKFDLSYAYPFMSLSFVLVLLFSILFLNEPANIYKILGTAIILFGIIVISRAYD
ncbi:MAG: EamA family transporter [Legionellales bacterium]|nr:EamA family transporter [Legionellales bacterium]